MHLTIHRQCRLLLALAVLLAAHFLCGRAFALNPEVRLRDYHHAAWRSKDGAPSEIKAMAQTPDGWLWLGSSSGLYRFDGVRFERYPMPAGSEIAKLRVSMLRAAPNGDLWMSFSVGGVSVLRKDGRLESPVPLDSTVGSIYTVTSDRDGSTWISAGTGLYLYSGGQVRKQGAEQGLPQGDNYSTLLDQYGQLWTLTPEGLYRLDRASGRFTLVHAQRNEGYLLQSPDGRLWLVVDAQLWPVPQKTTLPPGQQRVLPRAADGAARDSREFGQFDRDGNLWTRNCPELLCVVAHAGRHADRPLVIAGAGVDRAEQRMQMTSSATNAILEDMEGNIWVATQNGLDRFRENALIPVRLPQASGNFSMGGDSEGNVWLSDATNAVTWRLRPGAEPERWPQYYRIVANGRDGALLLGGLRYIERRDHGQVSRIALPPGRDGKPADIYLGGLIDDGKVLWTASPQTGLIGYLDGHWQPRSAFSLPARIFTGTSGRQPGERWHATGDGTAVFNDNGKLTTYDASAIGLASLIYARDDVLIGGDQGLAVFTGKGFRKFNAQPAEVLHNISGVAVSADGDRWLNGARGVVHVRRAAWEAALAKPDALLEYDLLGQLDGYEGQAMLDNRLHSVYTDPSGQIWFMTTSAVLRLAPGPIRHNAVAPTPYILGLDIGAQHHQATAGLRLAPGAQNFSIRFTAPGLRKPEAMRFQYQLSGVNDEWQEAGNLRAAYYTNVAPGSYTFRVRAFNEDGVMSTREARFDFEIEPRFVQTIWFKALCGVALAALLYLLYLYRLRIATKRVAARMTVRMAERERIARTLHDTFLQSVQALILRLDVVSAGLPEEARNKLAPILDQASDTIVEGRDQVYELRTGRVDNVESAAEEAGRQLRAEHPSTTFGFAVAGARRKLRDTVAEEACEIAREALRNAFHHADAQHVEAHVIYEPEHFTLQISDDGKGMAPDAESKQKHYGLTGMRERAVRAGGKLDIGPAPGGGVRVSFTVPSRTAYVGGKRWWQRFWQPR
ncbi:MAG TPA: triple tyrosine motif-containing protein [Duganella sp.]|nr:triple tyrosine motif-containing protein [Duganella sp.]